MTNQEKYLDMRIKHHRALLDGSVIVGTEAHLKLKAIILAYKLKSLWKQ